LVEIDIDFFLNKENLIGLNHFFSKDKLKTCLNMVMAPADEAFEEMN